MSTIATEERRRAGEGRGGERRENCVFVVIMGH